MRSEEGGWRREDGGGNILDLDFVKVQRRQTATYLIRVNSIQIINK